MNFFPSVFFIFPALRLFRDMHVLPSLNVLFCHRFPPSFSGFLPENIGRFLLLFLRFEPEIEFCAFPKTEIERDNE